VDPHSFGSLGPVPHWDKDGPGSALKPIWIHNTAWNYCKKQYLPYLLFKINVSHFSTGCSCIRTRSTWGGATSATSVLMWPHKSATYGKILLAIFRMHTSQYTRRLLDFYRWMHRICAQMRGRGEVAGPQSLSTAVHRSDRSPNKLWLSNSIFNLCMHCYISRWWTWRHG